MQYLYLIQCQQYFKIGIANDVENRLAQLSTGNPFELKVLAVYGFTNAQAVEVVLHQRFANSRKRGEWFELRSHDLEVFYKICQLLDGQTAAIVPTVEEEEIAEAEEQQELIGGLDWRIERRLDRNPPGFVIVKRGKEKQYLAYVRASSLKDPNYPTVEEIETVLKLERKTQ